MFSGTRLGARRVFFNRTALPLRASVRFQSNAAGTSEDGWELVVGLEIHAQLKTGRKLFSGELKGDEILADFSCSDVL